MESKRLEDLTPRQQRMLTAAVDREDGLSPESTESHAQSGRVLERLGLLSMDMSGGYEGRRWRPTDLGRKVRRS